MANRRPATHDDLGNMVAQIKEGISTNPKIMHTCGLEIVADRLTPGLFYCTSPAHLGKGWMLPLCGINEADPSLYALDDVLEPKMALIHDENLGCYRLVPAS